MDLAKPVFDLKDIAWSLSMQCRYTGRCKFWYSVAAHSLLVSQIMASLKIGDPLEGLLHDAGESTMSDLASPIKRLVGLDGYRAQEDIFDRSVRSQWHLPSKKTKECKRADLMARWMEAYILMETKGVDWVDVMKLRDDSIDWAMDNDWPFLSTQIDGHHEAPLELYENFLFHVNDLVKVA